MVNVTHDPLSFVDESDTSRTDLRDHQLPPWHVLIVDDEPQVHDVTKLALIDFEFRDRPLQFHHAYSGADAISKLRDNEDICLILLDVVMESDDAGFDVVQYVRENMQNREIRIILRTGQPGQAPPKDVVKRYDINDYHNKTDLSNDKLFISIYTALGMYSQLVEHRRYEEKLAAANREIEQLVYIASHDLQEPLRSVTSLCKRLQKTDVSSMSDTGQRCIAYIVEAIEHMSELVTDLLDYSRINEAQPTRNFDINQVVDELRSDLAHMIEKSGATITCSGENTICAQRIKIKMLLQNLITNSIKYSRAEEKPSINVEVVAQGRDVTIRVTDNGVGIPEQYRSQIFKVFQGLEDKDQSTGTGIGLAHCKRISEIHGGHIDLESEPGTGTTISCFLPGARA